MSKQPMRDVEPGRLAEEQVVDHLTAHPEFFERHPAVLARLNLPHQRGSAAISLVERQMLVLRERHAALEQRLRELIENGRANDGIVERMHRLGRRLLRAPSAEAVLNALDASLREDFGVSRWVMVLTDTAWEALGGLRDGSVRVVARGSAELRPFESFFESGRPRSGPVREAQRDYLFATDGLQLGSMALVPLGERAGLGLLALGSHDTERFLPTMSTDFLVRIGELVAEALTARGA
jgi:uncharacterized protein YigA (DUF484 family)